MLFYIISSPFFIFKIADLEIKCRHHQSERDLAEYNASVAAKQLEDMKLEIREKEKLYEHHCKSLPLHGVPQDPGKLTKMIKQLEFSNELTKQKLEKAEKQSKEFEAELRKLQDADLRNGSLQEDKKSLLAQLEQSKAEQQQKNKKLNELFVEMNRLQAHVDKLTDEVKKSKTQLEKKTTKIEELEGMLLQAREQVLRIYYLKSLFFPPIHLFLCCFCCILISGIKTQTRQIVYIALPGLTYRG